MKALFLIFLATVTAGPAALETRVEGAVTVTLAAQPEKALEFEVVVPASVHETWTAMTTSEGITTWLTPGAKVDLRQGGDWLVLWGGGVAPGGGTIVAFEPDHSLTIQAMVPEEFPTVRRERTTVVFTLQKIDDGNTRVLLRQTGWKEGQEWDQAYAHLAKGNAIVMNALRQRFVSGPKDWSAVMKARHPHH